MSNGEGIRVGRDIVPISDHSYESVRKMIDVFALPAGKLEVRQSYSLPYEVMYSACDVKTRTEYSIPTGIIIHIIQTKPGRLTVSPEIYKMLNSLP